MRARLVMTLLAASGCGEGDLAGGPDLRRARADLAIPPMEDAGWPDPDPTPVGGPPYPFVLVHGMAGFRKIGPLDYFYKIPDALRGDGHDVWVSQQDPINDSEARGPQVVAFVEQVRARTGKRKVNLIGHSQGGFDVRFTASALGAEKIATVTMIASPMKGTHVADLAMGAGPGAQEAMGALLELYGGLLGAKESDAKKQIALLTSAGSAAFFARHPDATGVAYFSVAGRSSSAAGGPDCFAPEAPLFVSRWDAVVDPLDALLSVPGRLLDGAQPRPVHDGLVPVASSRHGTFLGCIPADHLDEVNQLLGDSPGKGNGFDAPRFYRDLAGWLRWLGY